MLLFLSYFPRNNLPVEVKVGPKFCCGGPSMAGSFEVTAAIPNLRDTCPQFLTDSTTRIVALSKGIKYTWHSSSFNEIFSASRLPKWISVTDSIFPTHFPRFRLKPKKWLKIER